MSQVALATVLSLLAPVLGAQPAPAPKAAAALTLDAWLAQFRPGAPWPAPEALARAGMAVETTEGLVRVRGTVEGFQVLALTTDRKTVASCSLERPRAFEVGDDAAAEALAARLQGLMAEVCRGLGQTLQEGREAGNTTVHAGGYKAVYFGARVFSFQGGGFRGAARVDRGSRRYFYRNVEGDTPGSASLELARR